jgi:hypothetical protein
MIHDDKPNWIESLIWIVTIFAVGAALLNVLLRL